MSKQTPEPLAGEFRMPFSVDAPFYHRIPDLWPRTELPAGYIVSHQLNTVKGWDGCGLGVVISGEDAPLRTVHGNVGGHSNSLEWRIRSGWVEDQLPHNAAADQNTYFIDAVSNRCVQLWHPSMHANGMDVVSRFTPGPFALGTLGDSGAVHAAGMVSLGMLIRPGEAVNPDRPIRHALAGCTRRMWRARVWPAHMGDAALWSKGSSTDITGLIPYGAIVQLDPTLDLKTLKLSLPAFRILQAIQQYGWYNVDCGGPDLDVFTNTNADEYAAYGGVYQGPQGNGVQNQVQNVLRTAKLYLVPPPCRNPLIDAWIRARDVKAIAERRKSERLAAAAARKESGASTDKPAKNTGGKASVQERAQRDAALLTSVESALAAGRPPIFTSDLFSGRATIRSATSDGTLVLKTAAGEVSWSFKRLSRSELTSLAVDVARDEAGHALAAFYLLDAGRAKEAQDHLIHAGAFAEAITALFE
jgi:hypothetical protein